MGIRTLGLGAVRPLALAALMVGAATAVAADPVGAGTDSIFEHLRSGQLVTLEPRGPYTQINVLDEGQVGGTRVVEVRPQYIVVEDLVGVSRSWIPATAVSRVVWTRTGVVSR